MVDTAQNVGVQTLKRALTSAHGTGQATLKAAITRIGGDHHAADADSAYRSVLADVLATENEVVNEVVSNKTESVGSNRTSKEILHYSLIVENSRERLIHYKNQSFNLLVAVARFVWMMAGNDRLKDIEFYEPRVSKFSDDGVIIPGSSYGHRMIYPAPGCNQIDGVVARLKKESATRRAAISVYRAEDAVRESNDIPCTFGLAFHNRSGFLHPSVVMRSNNAFTLLPYNIFEFSMLGEAVAAEVGLELGSMSYYAMSMHVYSNNYQAAQNIVDAILPASNQPIPAMPRDPSPLGQIQELVKLEAEARHGAAGFSGENFESKWIHSGSEKLHPYWQQFYYLLLLAMCKKVEFQSGVMRLQEYIVEPWISRLRKEIFTTTPAPSQPKRVQELDLFGQHIKNVEKPRIKVSSQPDIQVAATADKVRKDSTVISKADLENELDQILKLYKPYVAQGQWSDVANYRETFLAEATKTPENVSQVISRLRELKFSLIPGEKVETNRAPAERIINELKKLLK